jgi:YHS domain-containing protein
MALNQKTQYTDPVCGMQVDPGAAAAMTQYHGSTVYFCAKRCQEAFDANPQKYARQKPKGFWGRYLDRLNKATGGKPPSCCG